MANLEITNNETDGIVVWEPVFRDELITFAGIATLMRGTILARKAVEDAVTASAVTGTGTGTVTLATVAAGSVVPLVGVYNLEVTEAVAEGGVLKLEDPNGALVASGLTMTVGAGAATVFEAAGLEFTVTDGGTDFIVGDFFSLTVAADGKMVPFATDGAGGAQIPKEVIRDALTSTGAGDLPCRPIVSGQVRAGDLVIDGAAAGVGITDAIIDQLRDFGIIAMATTQRAELDNQ